MKDFSSLAVAEATNHVIEAPAFATRAQAGLLDVLGWDVAASPRRAVERHAPLQCCFILRDGAREEAAFGYTGLSLPQGDAGLSRAQARVETFLDRLGEVRGVLLQNRPLVAFGQNSVERIAIFGGWRYDAGQWSPFLLGPDGLGGVAGQAGLFASGTLPRHLAEICGHPAPRVVPKLARPGPGDRRHRHRGPARCRADTGSAAGAAALRLTPFGAGWSLAEPGRPRAAGPVSRLPRRRPAPTAAPAPAPATPDAAPRLDPFWDPEADDFRFNLATVERK